MKQNIWSSVETALADLKAGRMIMVTDDEHRENEGDLIIAAQYAVPEAVNFMAVHARGLICMPVSAAVAERFDFAPMTARNTDNHETAFAVSVDHVSTATGISAYDRSATALALVSPETTPQDFRRPGHMFPLIAVKDGVLRRAGHTEATVDFCRLAGLAEAGLCCEIMSADGHMARLPELAECAVEWNIHLVSIASLVRYRKSREQFIERAAAANLPTRYGMFRMYGYVNRITGEQHAALVMGDVSGGTPVLCRIHSECLTGDSFGSLKCDCGQQYDAAMRRIAGEGRGVLVYLAQEGRGIGLINKIKAYALQDGGLDTVDANLALGLPEDARDYSCGIQILRDLGISKIRLMTNNPRKIDALGAAGSGIEVTARVPLQMEVRTQDAFYLRTKAHRMGHLLTNV